MGRSGGGGGARDRGGGKAGAELIAQKKELEQLKSKCKNVRSKMNSEKETLSLEEHNNIIFPILRLSIPR